MKLLYILNTTKKVNNFSQASMLAAKELGVEFHIAGNWGYSSEQERQEDEKIHGIRIHQVPICRSPYSLGNLRAYGELSRIVEEEKIDCIHCNTPVGGLLGRLLGAKKKLCPVIYQAHGFHFYRGAPVLNWLLYYPAERLLARLTDGLITINREDCRRAEGFPLRKGGKKYYLPGVGIDVNSFSQKDEALRADARQQLGLGQQDVLLLSVGELNKNKNNRVLLTALTRCGPSIHLALCGAGAEEAALRRMTRQLGLEDRVHFLGFCPQLRPWLAAADIFVMASLREGLSRAVLEAMASGLPCIVSKIRGNEDLITAEEGGLLCKARDAADFARAMDRLAADPEARSRMGSFNRTAVEDFALQTVVERTVQIYRDQGITDREL